MKKLIGSIVAVAGLAAAANAQTTSLRYEVRKFNAGDNNGWSASYNATPGDTIEVRAVVSLVGATMGGGLKQIVFQPVVNNWTGADTLIQSDIDGAGPSTSVGVGPVGGSRSTPVGLVPDAPGAYGRLTPWGANATSTSTFLRGHIGTGTAAGLLRIAQANITNWIGSGATSGSTANNNFNGGGGVSVAQISFASRLATDPAFEPGQTNLVVFKFAFTLSSATDARTLDITTPLAGIGRSLSGTSYIDNVQWFNGPQSGDADFSRTGATVEAGHVVIAVPAPASMALMGLGALVAGRRRR